MHARMQKLQNWRVTQDSSAGPWMSQEHVVVVARILTIATLQRYMLHHHVGAPVREINGTRRIALFPFVGVAVSCVPCTNSSSPRRDICQNSSEFRFSLPCVARRVVKGLGGLYLRILILTSFCLGSTMVFRVTTKPLVVSEEHEHGIAT
mmetsp:Transcript_3236/g.4669  ORF Transcript_3236/g.4669 Transcript_3236/m.4669 type:complete len:150 (-) Transcript_3236:352-801(-)